MLFRHRSRMTITTTERLRVRSSIDPEMECPACSFPLRLVNEEPIRYDEYEATIDEQMQSQVVGEDSK